MIHQDYIPNGADVRLTTFILSALALAVAGCAGAPPAPPKPEGEFRPINRVEEFAPKTGQIDFVYEGDVSGVPAALARQAAVAQVLPPIGRATPTPIRIDVRGGSVEFILKAINDQGSGAFEVVFRPGRAPGIAQTFVRYTPKSK